MINLRNGIGFLVICLYSFFQPTFAAVPGSAPLPTPIARVVWIKGTFIAVMQNNEKRSLQKKSIIYLHDTLMTDNQSQAEIVFTDNTLITFKEGTNFSVDTYSVKKKGQSSFVSSLATGGFRTITGIVAHNNPGNYQVNTPVATIGVRGTDYQAVLSKGSLYMAVYKGIPCVKTKPTDPRKKATELCLDKDHPYLEVKDANSDPVPLSQAPADLGEQLIITNAYLGQFAPPSSPGGGPITSFCITQ